FAEHHEAASLGIARAQMEITQPASPASAAPFGGKDDEVECSRVFDLQPRAAAAACRIWRIQGFRHQAFVSERERLAKEVFGLRLVGENAMLNGQRRRRIKQIRDTDA